MLLRYLHGGVLRHVGLRNRRGGTGRERIGLLLSSELLLGGGADPEILLPQALRERFPCCIDTGREERFALEDARAAVESQFGENAAELEPVQAALRAAGALLITLKELQRSALGNVRTLEYYVSGRFMDLDPSHGGISS